MKALEKSRRQLLAHQRSPLCQRLVDLSKIEGLLEPYTYERERLQTNDYKGVEVRGSFYRTHEGYELQMAVDMAVSEAHARGDLLPRRRLGPQQQQARCAPSRSTWPSRRAA